MEFTSPQAERRYDALVAAAAATVVGLDFDGVLSPIVEEPSQAHIHPGAAGVNGSVIVNTPSARSADTASVSILEANSNVREKAPWPRST